MSEQLLTEYMTPEEVAAELRIRPSTLSRWHRLNQPAPPKTKIGKTVWYARPNVIAWLREHEQAPVV
jgi:hypothetical protein